MRKAIHKYPMTQPLNVVQMPMGAEPIHFGCDPMGVLCLWAIIDPSALASSRSFRIIGTGAPEISPTMTYIGTEKVGPYMWHLFEDRA